MMMVFEHLPHCTQGPVSCVVLPWLLHTPIKSHLSLAS